MKIYKIMLPAIIGLLLLTMPVAAQMLPNNPFYGFKIFIENVQLWLTPDPLARIELNLQFAGQRLAELNASIAANRTDYVQSLAQAYQDRLVAAKSDLTLLRGLGRDVNEAAALFSSRTAAHTTLINQLANTSLADVQPIITRTAEFLQQSRPGPARWSSWSTEFEDSDSGTYSISVQSQLAGFVLYWYATTGGDQDDDYVQIMVYGRQNPAEDYGVVGFSRIGYHNDHKSTVGGSNLLYYALPRSYDVSVIKVTLYSKNGNPRMDTTHAWVEKWSPGLASGFEYSKAPESSWIIANNPVNEGGKTRVGVAACGTGSTSGCPQESGITYRFFTSFRPPKTGTADVYVETSHAGGVNTFPESQLGSSNYVVKLDLGIGQADTLQAATRVGRNQTLLKLGSLKQFPVQDFAVEVADAGREIAEEVARNPAIKTAMKGLGWISTVLDIVQVFASFTWNEEVSAANRAVFTGVKIDNQTNFYAWQDFVAKVKASGLTAIAVNFAGGTSWGEAFNLPDGGLQFGAILFHYPTVTVLSTEPHGEGVSVKQPIVIHFDKQINPSSVWVWLTAPIQVIPDNEFYERWEDDFTTLRLEPVWRLDYNTSYTVVVTQQVQASDGSTLIEPISWTFRTEPGPGQPRERYYKVTIASEYGVEPLAALRRGQTFNAKPAKNITISELRQLPAVTAGFSSNDLLYDCWTLGDVYGSGDTFYFEPMAGKAERCPHRDIFQFKLTDLAPPPQTPKGNYFFKIEGFGGNSATGIAVGQSWVLEPVATRPYSRLEISPDGWGLFYTDNPAYACANNTKLNFYRYDLPEHTTDPAICAEAYGLRMCTDFVISSEGAGCEGAWRLKTKIT